MVAKVNTLIYIRKDMTHKEVITDIIWRSKSYINFDSTKIDSTKIDSAKSENIYSIARHLESAFMTINSLNVKNIATADFSKTYDDLINKIYGLLKLEARLTVDMQEESKEDFIISSRIRNAGHNMIYDEIYRLFLKVLK